MHANTSPRTDANVILRLASRLKRLSLRCYAATLTWLASPFVRPAGDAGKLIYDLGFHIGQDTAFYLKKGFRVVAIEADPALVRAGTERFAADIASGDLCLINCGIVAPPATQAMSFFVNTEHQEWSSFDRAVAARAGHSIQEINVPCETLDSVMDKFGTPYFVKIDIEGNDVVALNSMLNSQYRPQFLSVENGNLGMVDMLTKAGYNRFKYVQQRDVPRQRPPCPPAHGRYVKSVFAMGSSGLFGDEAPGRWTGATEVRREIAKVWDPDGSDKNPDHIDSRDGWFDLHARHESASPLP